MRRYAQGTTVSVSTSREEIQRTVERYGADAFSFACNASKAMIQFEARDRHIRFVLELPSRLDKKYRFTAHRRNLRSDDNRDKAWEQDCRQLWRALALCIKAKLEAVEAGITTFDNEFMAHIVLPDGLTIGETIVSQIEAAYKTGDMPLLLEAPKKTNEPTHA